MVAYPFNPNIWGAEGGRHLVQGQPDLERQLAQGQPGLYRDTLSCGGGGVWGGTDTRTKDAGSINSLI